jgi:TRAP-type mannitol/chloroaromatic compound transport system permease small subunit
MQGLLRLSKGIDALNHRIGQLVMWLVLVMTVISAGNAIVRKAFDISSNAMLEIQWYLFAAVFMLGAGYALLHNAHVRIDFISSRLSPRARNWIDVIGILLVLFPFCLLCGWLAWPLFTKALASGETSTNAGGLIRWPVYLTIPVGFALLFLQGGSELIKRWAFLQGAGPDTLAHQESEEDKLLAELAEQAKNGTVNQKN